MAAEAPTLTKRHKFARGGRQISKKVGAFGRLAAAGDRRCLKIGASCGLAKGEISSGGSGQPKHSKLWDYLGKVSRKKILNMGYLW